MAMQMFCTAADHRKHPPPPALHRSAHLLHSAPAHRCCNHLHGGNVHKCWFLGTTEKEAALTLSTCRGRVTDTFCTHMTGLFADIFSCCPAFGACWAVWEALSLMWVSILGQALIPALLLHLSSSQAAFSLLQFPSWQPSTAGGHTGTLSTALLGGPCISEQCTAATASQAKLISAADPNASPRRSPKAAL